MSDEHAPAPAGSGKSNWVLYLLGLVALGAVSIAWVSYSELQANKAGAAAGKATQEKGRPAIPEDGEGEEEPKPSPTLRPIPVEQQFPSWGTGASRARVGSVATRNVADQIRLKGQVRGVPDQVQTLPCTYNVRSSGSHVQVTPSQINCPEPVAFGFNGGLSKPAKREQEGRQTFWNFGEWDFSDFQTNGGILSLRGGGICEVRFAYGRVNKNANLGTCIPR